jgi:hypothetical protein
MPDRRSPRMSAALLDNPGKTQCRDLSPAPSKPIVVAPVEPWRIHPRVHNRVRPCPPLSALVLWRPTPARYTLQVRVPARSLRHRIPRHAGRPVPCPGHSWPSWSCHGQPWPGFPSPRGGEGPGVRTIPKHLPNRIAAIRRLDRRLPAGPVLPLTAGYAHPKSATNMSANCPIYLSQLPPLARHNRRIQADITP